MPIVVRRALAGLALLVASVRLSGAAAADPLRAADDDAAPASSSSAGDDRSVADGDAAPVDAGLEETLTVTGRLGAGGPVPLSGRPVSAEVHEGDELRRTGARSLSEALARLPSLVPVDQVGNGRQLVLDLRGFGGSAGATALVVDGVRVNDADTGTAAFERWQLSEIDRVVLEKGALGPLFGGGSLAGAVRLVRRRPEREPSARFGVLGGTRSALGVSAAGTGPAGPAAWLVSAGREEADGFRSDRGYRESFARAALSWSAGGVDAWLDHSRFDGRWSHPGALTAAELAADPWTTPANALDGEESRQDLSALHLESSVGRVDWALVVARRAEASTVLSTGRSDFGFLSRRSAVSTSASFEAVASVGGGRVRPRWGLEVRRERSHPTGWLTGRVSAGRVGELDLSSDVRLRWEGAAVFAGTAVELPFGLALEAGVRHDTQRMGRAGKELGSSGLLERADGRRRFDRTTGGAGMSWVGRRADREVELRAAWSQSFLAPSSIQLFAYPGFGSNPDLAPQRGRSLVVGASARRRAWALDVEAFEVSVADEVVYDQSARRNLNAGRTRRRGIDLALTARPHRRVAVTARAVLVDARFRGAWVAASGPVEPGGRVPLVPSSRAGLRVALGPVAGLSGSIAWRRTGSVGLDGDFDGSSARLPARDVVDLEASVLLPAGRRRAALELSFAVENVLDDVGAVRGIDQPGGPYYTPALPRTVSVGVTHSF